MPGEGGSKRWLEVQALVRSLEPRLIEMFRRYEVPPAQAGAILEEVVTLLLYRWKEVAHPEAWMMEILEYRLERERSSRENRELES